MLRNRISLFVGAFLIVGFFFMALPEEGFSGRSTIDCCQITSTTCFEPPVGSICRGDFLENAFCDETNGRCRRISNVPTLSEWGLVIMSGVLGIIGFMVIRRRKVTA